MYKIRPGKKEDIKDVIAICDRALGTGYLSPNAFENASLKWLSVIKGDRLVGFGMAEIQSRKTLTKMLGFPSEQIFDGERFGYMQTIVISEKYRGQGISKRVFSNLLSLIKKSGVTLIYGRAWHNGNHMPAANLLRSLGFNQMATILSPWELDSLNRRFSCPVCGQPPCLCHAGLFVYQPEK